MNPILIPFMWGLFLGRTIDLTTYNVGNNDAIFDAKEYDEVPIYNFEYRYFVVDNAVPYDYAKIPLDIAIQLKRNVNFHMNQSAFEDFVKMRAKSRNSVYVVAVAIQRTVKRTLKPGAMPVPEWQKKLRTNQTHYVHGLIYGAAAVAIQEFACDSPADTKVVKDILHSHLGTEGPLDFLTQEKWDEVLDAIFDNKFLKFRVDVYGRNNINANLDDPYSIRALSFVNFVKMMANLMLVGKNVGEPLYSQLKPLRDLDSSFPNVTEKRQTIRNLKILDPMMDDVSSTESNLWYWVRSPQDVIEGSDYTKILDLGKKMKKVMHKLRYAARVSSGRTSFYNYMNESAFNEATKLYNGTVAEQGGTFHLTYKKLREDINVQCEDSFFEEVKGLLIVSEDETVFTGTVKKGLEECKAKCYATIRCKSFGYTDSTQECRLYSRSTNTAGVSKQYEGSAVYDRKCHGKKVFD